MEFAVDPQAEVVEIETLEPRAWVRNRIEVVLTAPGESSRRMSGYAMSILRKEPDGRWRIARDANLVMPGLRVSGGRQRRGFLAGAEP